MYRIAICEDNPEESQTLEGFVREYISDYSEKAGVLDIYHHAAVILEQIQRGQLYDVYLIDINMPEIDGMELGRLIRAQSKDVSIIFTTSSEDHALDAYHIHAVGYLLKPVVKTEVYQALDMSWTLYHREVKDLLALESTDGIRQVSPERIMYIENSVRMIKYVLSNKETIICNRRSGTFESAVGAIAKNQNFIQPHKSYFINMNYVRLFSSDVLVMDDEKIIPMAQKRKPLVKEAYFTFLTERGKNL